MGAIDLAKSIHDRAAAFVTPQPVVFHHVPKCGGTSVGRALRKRYLLSQTTVLPEASFRAYEAFTARTDRDAMLVDVADLREQMLLYALYAGHRCVSLHVPFSQTAYDHFAGRYKFVTVLREPVARFLSHYHWCAGRADDHGRIDEDLEHYLETDRARRMGASYVEYYSGRRMAEPLAATDLIHNAIQNLKSRFDVVGRLDKLPELRADLRAALGVRVRIGHENKGQQGDARALSPQMMDRLREICAPDIAIWTAFFGEQTA